jgi:ATP-dependent DNA helicase RecG
MKSGDVFDSYKRSAGQTVKLTRQEIKQLIAQSTGLSFEAQVAHRNLSDDEALQMLDYDSYFSLQEKRLPETKKGILEALAGFDSI